MHNKTCHFEVHSSVTLSTLTMLCITDHAPVESLHLPQLKLILCFTLPIAPSNHHYFLLYNFAYSRYII